MEIVSVVVSDEDLRQQKGLARAEVRPKKPRSALGTLRQTKSKSPVVLQTWLSLFSNKLLLATLLPFLHVLDIIHLAETCRQLYTRFYGNQLTRIIIPLVQRDFGTLYKVCPLQNLSKGRTAVRIATPENCHAIQWKARRCASCPNGIQDQNWSPVEVRYLECPDCQNKRSYIKKGLELSIRLLGLICGRTDMLRIERVLKRYSLAYGAEIEALPCANFYMHKFRIVDKMIADLSGQIRFFDIGAVTDSISSGPLDALNIGITRLF
jgi:hypothetical protein